MLGKVYCLVDPRTDKPFYIGTTYRKLSERLHGHIADSKITVYKKGTILFERCTFIRDMINEGFKPVPKLLFIANMTTANLLEGYVYRYFTKLGYNLIQSDCHFFTNNLPKK